MKCPFCYSEDTMLVDEKWIERKVRTRRRYLCTSCSNHYSTYEELSEKATRQVRIYRLKIGGRN